MSFSSSGEEDSFLRFRTAPHTSATVQRTRERKKDEPLDFVVLDDELLLEHFNRVQLTRLLLLRQHDFSKVSLAQNGEEVEIVETGSTRSHRRLSSRLLIRHCHRTKSLLLLLLLLLMLLLLLRRERLRRRSLSRILSRREDLPRLDGETRSGRELLRVRRLLLLLLHSTIVLRRRLSLLTILSVRTRSSIPLVDSISTNERTDRIPGIVPERSGRRSGRMTRGSGLLLLLTRLLSRSLLTVLLLLLLLIRLRLLIRVAVVRVLLLILTISDQRHSTDFSR